METGGRMVSIDSDIEVNYNWDTDPSEIEDDYGEIQEKVEEKVRDEYYQDDSGSGYMREEYLDENNEYQDYEIRYDWTKEVTDGAEEEIKSWAETDLSMNAETFEAREDLICDYCEKIISPNEGSVNWSDSGLTVCDDCFDSDSGLTVCDDCFDDAIKNAESSNTKLLGIGAGILATIFYMYFQK
jgi:hypothetical protein